MAFSSAGNTSTTRSMVFAAEVVCRVPNTRWPVSAAVRGQADGFQVAHLADQDDVRVLPQRRAQRFAEAEGVAMHLALVDQALLRFVDDSIGSSMVRMWWYLVLFR